MCVHGQNNFRHMNLVVSRLVQLKWQLGAYCKYCYVLTEDTRAWGQNKQEVQVFEIYMQAYMI